jgi:endo-1,4-beta-xylanase
MNQMLHFLRDAAHIDKSQKFSLAWDSLMSFFKYRIIRWLISFPLAFIAANCWAIDSYNSANGVLTISKVAVGDVLYSNVSITLDKILAVGSQAVADSYDTFNPDNNQLSIPSVQVGTEKYYSVVITVGKVIGVGNSCTGVFSCYNASLPSLAQVYAGKFLFGFGGVHDTLVRTKLLETNSTMHQIVTKQSNIININCFYAASVHPSSGVWKWTNCDALLAMAEKNPTWKKRAHVAFWPFNDNPSLNLEWLLTGSDGKTVTREQAIELLRDHITTMMTRYKGRFDYWDIVNEAVDYTQPDGIRSGPWKDVIGSDLVEVAFAIAREADPSAKLFYNDFNEWVPAKREAIYAMVKKLKDKGLIDGIGMQQHVKLASPTAALLDTAISRYAELGLEIHVTELDVEINPNGTFTELTSDLSIALANRYKELFTVYAKYPGSITAVMTWNVTDSSSWLLSFPTVHTTWPLLFDKDGLPKMAFWGLTN